MLWNLYIQFRNEMGFRDSGYRDYKKIKGEDYWVSPDGRRLTVRTRAHATTVYPMTSILYYTEERVDETV